MPMKHFHSIFHNIKMPVVICLTSENYPLVYWNASAKMLLDPAFGQNGGDSHALTLEDVVRFQSIGVLEQLMSSVKSTGSIGSYKATVCTVDERLVPMVISASLSTVGDREHCILYLQEEEDEFLTSGDADSVMNMVFHIAYHTADPNEAINSILRLAGSYVHACRAYVFEELSEEHCRLSYEWCRAGIAPLYPDLQKAKKADQSYEDIISGGGFVSDSIDEAPEPIRSYLSKLGVRSLALFPMFHIDSPIGYIGFNDRVHNRSWQRHEIALLCNIADVVMSLIIRRKSDEQFRLSLQVLQTITDNIDSLIYVNNIQTHEVIFINQAMANALEEPAENIIGRKCWQTLQKDMDGPCPFCPIPRLQSPDGERIREDYTWEFQNTLNQRWYLVRDSIIEWVNGVNAHIETATEITYRKQYEQRLKEIASKDAMTGIKNREWGSKLMQKIFLGGEDSGETICLCFLDLDGLKRTNDTYGHDAGDDLILRTVETIRAGIRKSDVMFRWGGDEFIILLRCNMEEADLVMRHIQERLDKINRCHDKPYSLSFSYGITEFGGADSVEAIVSRADQLMYRNKMNKRGMDVGHV